MSNWINCKLGDFLTFHYGKSLSAEKRIEGKIPVYSSAGLTGWHNEALVESEGLIVGRKGTIGKVYKSNQPFFVIDTAYYIKPDEEKYDLNYVYYLLSSIGLEDLNEDSAVPGLNRNTAYSQDISLPPLSEQKAIAEVLTSLDDKIDLLHKQNKTLEQIAETLFRHHFIDNAQDGWEVGKLGDCVTISYGKNLPTNQLLESGYPVFGGNGQIGFFDKFLYADPQVLVSCRGEASGKVNISLPNSFVTNNSLVLVRDKRSEISFEFLKYFALNYDFSLHVSGSAQPQITIDGLYGAEFVMPSSDVVKEYSDVVGDIEEKRLLNFYQIKNLEKLRDQLLPKLMSGEITTNLISKS